jgi:hypothetical protein
MHQAQSFAVSIDIYSKHSDEGKPNLWTYVEDELFIQTHPELKDDMGDLVSIELICTLKIHPSNYNKSQLWQCTDLCVDTPFTQHVP